MALKIVRHCVALLILASASTAFAQITFTFNYTPSTTQHGLTASQPAQWTWTINPAPAASSAQGFNWGSNISWEVSGQGQTHVWSSITGTGLTGSLNSSTIGFSSLAMANNGVSYLLIDAAASQSLGLTFNGYTVTGLRMYARPAGLAPSMSPPSLALASYVDDYFGAYSISDNSYTTLIFKTVEGGDLYLSNSVLTGVTIAGPAVPEPSTYAAILGVCVLGMVGWRRLRQRGRSYARPARLSALDPGRVKSATRGFRTLTGCRRVVGALQLDFPAHRSQRDDVREDLAVGPD